MAARRISRRFAATNWPRGRPTHPEETARLCEQAARLLERSGYATPADPGTARVRWRRAPGCSPTVPIQAGQCAEPGAARRAAGARRAREAGAGQPGGAAASVLGRHRLAERRAVRPESSAARHRPGRRQRAWRSFVIGSAAPKVSWALAVRIGQHRPGCDTPGCGPGAAGGPVLPADVQRLVREYPDEPHYPRPEQGLDPGRQGELEWRGATRKPRRHCAVVARWPTAGAVLAGVRPLHKDRLARLRRFLEARATTAAARHAKE